MVSNQAVEKQRATLERRRAFLCTIPLFQTLSSQQLDTVLNEVHARVYSRDELIFRQGDESRELYFVVKGKVRIFKVSPAGDETTITIFSTHDVIGEMAALNDEPRTATAKAMSKVTLLVISHERFMRFVEQWPALAVGLARLLSDKLRWTAAYAETVAQFDAPGRLLHILLLYTAQYGTESEPDHFRVDLGLNQSDLASMIGARREWVNRILRDWRKRGLLFFENGVIDIPSLDAVTHERDSRIEAIVSADEW